MFNTKLVGKPPQFMCLPVSRQRQWYQLRWRALSKRGRTVGGLHTTAKLADGCDLPSRFKGSMTLREAAAASCIRVSIAGVPESPRSSLASCHWQCPLLPSPHVAVPRRRRISVGESMSMRPPTGQAEASRQSPLSRRRRAIIDDHHKRPPGRAARLVLDRACQRPRVAFRADLRLRARPARGQREDEKAQATVSATCQCEPR